MRVTVLGDAGIKYIHLRMFIRKKKNRSGTTSVVVVEKKRGVFKELKTIGVSEDEDEIEKLVVKGQKWIATYLGEQDIFEQSDQKAEERQLPSTFSPILKISCSMELN